MSLKYAETQLTVIIIMWSGLTRDVDFSGHNVKFNRIVRIYEQHVIKGLGSFAKKTSSIPGFSCQREGTILILKPQRCMPVWNELYITKLRLTHVKHHLGYYDTLFINIRVVLQHNIDALVWPQDNLHNLSMGTKGSPVGDSRITFLYTLYFTLNNVIKDQSVSVIFYNLKLNERFDSFTALVSSIHLVTSQ